MIPIPNHVIPERVQLTIQKIRVQSQDPDKLVDDMTRILRRAVWRRYVRFVTTYPLTAGLLDAWGMLERPTQ